MKVDQAIAFINRVAFLPRWEFDACDWCHRQEESIRVRIWAPNPDTNAESLNEDGQYIQAVKGGAPYADFLITVGDLADDDFETLSFRLLNHCGDVFMHEAREALRDPDTKVSVFHPHRISGRKAWAKRTGRDEIHDITYGLV